MSLLKPKEITLKSLDGVDYTYIISRLPATLGREIVAKYPLSLMPKVGDYKVSEETMLKLMSCVGVPREGEPLLLTTRALVDNHVPDWETLAKLEVGMLEYNTSFFHDGKTSAFFAGIGQNIQQWITSTLTALLAVSSAPEKPHSMNSGPSMT